MSELAEVRAEARFLRTALGRPTAASHTLLRRRGLRAALLGLGADPARLPRRLQVPADLAQLEADYLATFEVGAPAPPVPLRESHWLRHVGANRVMVENHQFYDAFDLHVEPGGELSDHLVSQLAFVEYLAWAIVERGERGADAQSFRWALGDFARQHLRSWVPRAATAAAARPTPALLAALLVALDGWTARLAAFEPARG
ncbi:MAG TPA: molecular chaperone TorD family protein [Polyangia bacterium]|jgi:DMSO reductase family type II enzyme chaperone